MGSSIRLAVVMDPISEITIYKDSTFAMLLAAQKRGWPLLYIEQEDLSLKDNRTWVSYRLLKVKDDTKGWFELGESQQGFLDEVCNVLLMRKDPPFDMDYVFNTYLLELAESRGLLVINKPQSLRDANEKLFTAWFPQCCPPSLVSQQRDLLKAFIVEHKDVIVKPLDQMGGASIFRVNENDPNLNVILETITAHGKKKIMAQRFIPQITQGDKRILIVNGKVVPYALARIPQGKDFRGNLAAGGRGEGIALSERDQWIADQVAPELVKRGLIFVGIDVIGDYLTEINVTSPTCIRELDAQFSLDIAGDLMDEIEQLLQRG